MYLLQYLPTLNSSNYFEVIPTFHPHPLFAILVVSMRTACNIDLIVTKICICLNNGPRMGEFEYGPYWIYSACVIRNASFDEIT